MHTGEYCGLYEFGIFFSKKGSYREPPPLANFFFFPSDYSKFWDMSS